MVKELKTAFSQARLTTIANELGSLGVKRILDRTTQGKFVGGELANKGYSTKALYGWKLGEVTYNEDSQSLDVKPPASAPVTYAKSDLEWGKKGAKLKGGYKEFRKKSGRNVDVVDLRFTGAMLNSLRYSLSTVGNAQEILFKVAPDQQFKANETHEQREWLTLTDQEQSVMIRFVEGELFKRIK